MIKLNIQRFSSTNKTTHYDLSQYVSSDLPTYLVDYNGDMAKIDTAINSAQTTADTASTAATNAQTAAEIAQGTANTAVTNAGTAQTTADGANTKIGTLANLNTTEKTNLVGAINEVDSNIGNIATLTTDVKTNVVNAINSIETKIEELDNYSTSESLTGKKWTNNKPIYRKTIHFTGSIAQDGSTTAIGTVSNFDEIISLTGVVRSDNVFQELPYINFAYNNVGIDNIHIIRLYELNGDIKVQVYKGSNAPSTTLGYVDAVIEYTKSTD